MAIDEHHGFDIVATRARLEDWCLEHFAFPVGGGLPRCSGGRSEAIRSLLMDHWGEHGVHLVVKSNGALASAPRCFENPCAVLGVALAVIEIFCYERATTELEEIAWLKQAESRFSISELMRAELLAFADKLAASPLSRAIANQTAGRPKRILA